MPNKRYDMTSVDSVEKIETHDVKHIFRQNDKRGYGIFNLLSWYIITVVPTKFHATFNGSLH